MLCLKSLPYEVLSNIVKYISFDDVFSLGCTCKDLQYILKEESICKFIVQTKIRYSNEALTASVFGQYASALRRVAKRREAFATMSPFSVATVGVADAHIYCKGCLCYIVGDKIRVLDILRSSRHEIVVDIPGLLIDALSGIEEDTKGTFQILYYSDNIVSCIYKSRGLDETAWLIAFDIRKKEILVVKDLDSIDKIFVRHNGRYLYFGTHSELGDDGYKKWVIQGYDFHQRKWFDQKVHLPDLVGSELGQTICFEFHTDHFYALSNQTSFEVEEIDWTSFYNCQRFPLNSPCKELLEKTENKTMWRRQHQEGPIDDRWTSLRLDTDEATGNLHIVESRKEWHQGSSKIQRTNYTTEIKFAASQTHNYTESVYASTASSSSTATAVYSAPSDSFSSASSSSDISSSSDNTSGHDRSTLPNEGLVRLLTKDDNPHHFEPHLRLPQFTHPGDDGSSLPILTRTPLRYYHSAANTFVDLVDDPLPTDWQGKQRLRLRAASRKPKPVLRNPAQNEEHGLIRPASEDLSTALEETYRTSPVAYWPEDTDPPELYRLLNPLLGNVQGTADERSLVYATGPKYAPQAIVFVSFDPAIRLDGIRAWGGMSLKSCGGMPKKGVGEGPHIDGRATGRHASDVEHLDRTLGMEKQQDRKGKGKAHPSIAATGTREDPVDLDGDVESSGRIKGGWAVEEPAMYRTIDQAYWFGR